jgi:hypothetical protein
MCYCGVHHVIWLAGTNALEEYNAFFRVLVSQPASQYRHLAA